MGKNSSPELTLSFLLIAALCLEAVIIDLVRPSEHMTWAEARLYCQKNHIDLVSWKVVNRFSLAKWLVTLDVSKVWIGLHRDPEEDSVWKWINVKTGEGFSGDDLSQSGDWADVQQNSLCAVVGDEQMWYSVQCSSKYCVFCSKEDTILHYKVMLNWYNASQYCQDRASNLSTITKQNQYQLTQNSWIGLYQQADKNWSWIGGSSSEYRNWAPGEPLAADCGSFDPDTEKWYGKDCSQELPFICYDDNLVVVNENKTWEEALLHCKLMEKQCNDSSGLCEYRYNILSLQDLSEYSYVRDRIYRATTDEVWIGLRFLEGNWWWANGQKLDKPGLPPKCPSQWNHCGTLSKYDTNNWITRDCSERRNFICYRRISQ